MQGLNDGKLRLMVCKAIVRFAQINNIRLRQRLQHNCWIFVLLLGKVKR